MFSSNILYQTNNFWLCMLLANEKMRRYESGAAKRKKLTAAKTEIAKLTKLDSFFQASESVTSTQNQTDDATRTVLPEAAMVSDLDTIVHVHVHVQAVLLLMLTLYIEAMRP